MYCSQCGTEIADNSNLCEHCGSPIISNTRRETSINNDIPVPKSETRSSGRKQLFIVVGIILLIVGALVFIFSFEKPESDKPKYTVKPVVQKYPVETVVPKSTVEPDIPTHPVESIIPKPADEAGVPKSTVETAVPTPPVETITPKNTVESDIPTPPSSSSD
jgi:hypothetical protein